jgi:tryptophanyl-tRNA synthetase
MRPTGRLHIGHYFGALQNWVRLQNAILPSGEMGAEMGRSGAAPLQREEKEYECFYFIADWHALTSDYADTSAIAQNTIEIMTDYLASGLDPKKSVIFQQSLVPEHAELHLLLSMVTPLGWLERVPTYKEALENIRDKDLHTYGFLGYPTLQTADIVIYSEEGVPLVVPVGEDQVSHVEFSREIVRRFNTFYGLDIDYQRWKSEEPESLARVLSSYGRAEKVAGSSPAVLLVAEDINRAILRNQILGEGIANFRERVGPAGARYVRFVEALRGPDVMLTKTPRVPGLDGRKMSKSYGNAITLSESDADIRAKTKVMITDPDRKRRTDKGNPDVCPVYDWHKLFSTRETLEWAAQGCRTAGIGCIECKAKMADHLIEWITPVRERRVEYEKHPARVLEILEDGSKRARKVAQGTMERVREAVFGWEKKKKEVASGEWRVAR